MVGLIVGYLSYEFIHYGIHQMPWLRRLVKPLASHHLHHHYADDTRCFGVTSPLWDIVFRTGRRRRSAADRERIRTRAKAAQAVTGEVPPDSATAPSQTPSPSAPAC
jgi:sterol desaturase/sphingolipid hydroxylase (fatty acid hydroxylase superfamily)